MTNCTIGGCQRPTSDRLCATHLAELVTALRDLVVDGAAVGREADRRADERLRHGLQVARRIHAARSAGGEREQRRLLRAALALRVQARPEACGQGLYADLQDLVAGRVALNHGVSVANNATEAPLPLNVSASDLVNELDGKVGTWCRAVSEDNPHLRCDAASPVQAAAWLAAVPGILATHPAADELHAEVTDVVRRVRTMVDLRPDRVYLDECGAWLVDDIKCRAIVYAREGQEVTRCRACDTGWNVAERRAWMASRMDGQLLTASRAELALAALGMRVPASTIGTWATRDGLLATYPPAPGDPHARRRFRFGDVLDLANERQRKTA